MVQRGEELRFACEAGEAFRIAAERVGDDLDRDVAPQFRVARAIDFAHAASAQRRDDLIRTELAAWAGSSSFTGGGAHPAANTRCLGAALHGRAAP